VTPSLVRCLVFLALLFGAAAASAECISFAEAGKKQGEPACITGKVIKVAKSPGGNVFLDFCENYRQCPFTVVVFEKDAEKVGDLKLLEGQEVTIYGRIKEYHGKPEIILRDKRQLQGDKSKYLPDEDEPHHLRMDTGADASKHAHHVSRGGMAHHSSKKPKTSSSPATSASSSSSTTPPSSGTGSTPAPDLPAPANPKSPK
jgi:hypothetical protein